MTSFIRCNYCSIDMPYKINIDRYVTRAGCKEDKYIGTIQTRRNKHT